MQEIFVYIYNIAFIILYLWVINVSSYAYKSTNNNLFYYVEFLYVILIVDSTFAFSFDLLKTAFSRVNVYGPGYYLARTLIFLLGGIIYVKLMSKMVGQHPKVYFYLPIALAVVCDVIYGVLFYNNSQTIVWQRTVQDAGIFALCIIYFVLRKRNKSTSKNCCYDKIVLITACFMLLSCVEGMLYYWLCTLNNSFVHNFTNYMKIIGLSEDLYSLIVSIAIIWFARQEEDRARQNELEILVQHKMNQYQAMMREKEIKNEDTQVVEFCNYYKLTKRESEILRLVLNGKKNQEIADKLYISVGTVKSHIYSIFKKLSIDRRSQLMHVFMAYRDQ